MKIFTKVHWGSLVTLKTVRSQKGIQSDVFDQPFDDENVRYFFTRSLQLDNCYYTCKYVLT